MCIVISGYYINFSKNEQLTTFQSHFEIFV
jgi:hypothetical protein